MNTTEIPFARGLSERDSLMRYARRFKREGKIKALPGAVETARWWNWNYLREKRMLEEQEDAAFEEFRA